MSQLIVEVKQGVEALRALRTEWKHLFQLAGVAPFLSWEWAATWHKWFGKGKIPYLICVREGGTLIGLLALLHEVRRLAGGKLERFSLLGDDFGGADYLDMIAMPGKQEAVVTAISKELIGVARRGGMKLDGFATDSLLLAEIATRFRQDRGFICRTASQYVCPQVALGSDWREILRRSRRADNFKRRLRQLSVKEGFAHRVVTERDAALPAFERFLRLHNSRWAEAGGSEMTGHERLTSFHRDLVVRFAEAGLLRFDELWVEGECRASIYGLEHGRQYFFYNSGYEQAWRGASVGLVLLGLSIKSAVERGIEVYDFLRGTEAYKFDWAETTRETVVIRVAPKRPRAALLLAYEQARETIRKGAREKLPDWLLLPVQQVRRAWKREHELKENPIFSPRQQIEKG
jgi:CelD/BcsL family acetyltransferase involved in cellulose biosynthesis